VSGVSSIAIEAEEEDAVSVRAASDISTVPSLLSTRREESVRYVGSSLLRFWFEC
jgi:hypothetical protein